MTITVPVKGATGNLEVTIQTKDVETHGQLAASPEAVEQAKDAVWKVLKNMLVATATERSRK